MRYRLLTGLMAALLLALGPATARAAERAGVHMDNTLRVGSATLRLNGIGLRTKYFFQIYVAGLYLVRPSSNPAAIISADAPQALVMQFLRSIHRDTLVKAYRIAFSRNAPALAAREAPEVSRFLAFLPDVKDADRLTFTYQPGKGSTFAVNGGKPLVIPGRQFADLYLQVFIGHRPPTAILKKELLGRGAS